MKTLIIGDLHSHFQRYKMEVCDAINIFSPEEIVFLGDYIDSDSVTSNEKLIDLESLAYFKRELLSLNIKPVFLVGNHDYAYIFNFHLNKTSEDIVDEVRNILLNKLEVRLVHYVKPYLCSHAGILEKWLKFNKLSFSDEIIACEKLNEMFYNAKSECAKKNFIQDKEFFNYKNPAFILFFNGPGRGGMDKFAGPLWADRNQELITGASYNLNQIVGHTPVSSCNCMYKNNKQIWFCDTFTLDNNDKPLGDHSMLYVENTNNNETFIQIIKST